MADIEDEKNNYEELIKTNNEAIENFKEKNKILQSELEYNNNEIKFLEQEKNIGLSKVTLKEKQLHKKIEKFIGAKIFQLKNLKWYWKKISISLFILAGKRFDNWKKIWRPEKDLRVGKRFEI